MEINNAPCVIRRHGPIRCAFQIKFSRFFSLFVAPLLTVQGDIGAPLVLVHYKIDIPVFSAHRLMTWKSPIR
jgi:hypothetical protein